MSRRVRLGAILAIGAIAASAAFAASASATPNKTSQCSNCHDGAGATIVATLVSTVGSTATYNVSASGADAIAVFSGSTKLATINGSSGQFAVTTGSTYNLFAVTGPSTSDGLGTASVSPVATAIDLIAPVTTSNAVATYVSSAAITLSATDAGSGVANTYYKLDGGAQVAGKAISTSVVGAHTIEFWSVDVAGNAEAHKTASFTVTAPVPVDVTAPVTTSNAVATYVSSAAITLSATDAGSGVANTYYKLDGGAQVAGKAISTSVVGAHTIEFWSVDVAGNAEAHKTASFTVTAPVPVDVTAPVTTSNAVATYVSSAAITLSATDAGSGVANTYYKLDGGAQVAGKAISTSVVGAHTIEFWSVDVAGNAEAHKTASFTVTAPVPVDVTAPVTTSNAVATYVSSAAITLSATDAGSGVANTYYKLDGGAQVAGKAISTSVVGAHTIEFWSVDVAGNAEAHKTASFTVTAPVPVDVTAPVTTSNAVATYVSSAAITLSATDAGSGVANTYYKLDGGAQVAGKAISTSVVGAHTIEFWSVDVAGNAEAHKTASFTVTAPVPVDVTAPVTTSNAVATYVSSAAITLSATDAGSGVANTYYKLDGGAQVAGKAISTSVVGAHTIEFWSVDVAGNAEAHKTASFTVTAPVPVDVTAPVTTSNAVATYVSSAAITLSATDAGSGVANTYYKLDGGAQVAGKAISTSVVGAHTIEFWSVDVAGNAEAHKTASFTVTAPPVASGTTTTTLSIRASYNRESEESRSSRRVSLSGRLTPGTEDLNVSLYVMKPGSSRWTLVRVLETNDSEESAGGTWSYRFSPTAKGSYKFQVRFAGTTALSASVSKIVTVSVR